MTQHHITNEKAIFTLWLNWTIAVGAIALPEFAALFVPRSWIPIITFAVMILLIIYRNTGKKFQASSCDLVQTICVHTLCVSAVIMVLISIIYARGFISLFYPEELLNVRIPYLTILILGPVATIYCLIYTIRGNRAGVCRRCIIRYGTSTERGFLGKVFSQESRYQVRFLMIISGVLSVITWTYYACYYINVNLNSSDRFFYNWIPSIFYGLSVIFFGMRYFTLWSYYYNHIEMNPRVCMNGSGVRFILLNDDNIFLSRIEEFNDMPDGNKYDTPADVNLAHRNYISLEDASQYLVNLSGLDPESFNIRFMYKSTDMSGKANIFHFICCFRSKEAIADSSLRGQWYSLSQLQRLLYNKELTHMLTSEIHRLHTVTMAWKTYDINGLRLYKIKNYRPAFRLKGICDWNVDFDNPLWLDVARFNEDSPLFKLRRLLRRRQRQSINN